MGTETEKTGGGDRGLWLQLFPEDLQRLAQDQNTFTKYLYPLARWYLGMKYEPPQGPEANFIFGKLKDQQLRSADAQQARRDGGKQTAQKRWGGSRQIASKKQASSKQKSCYANENENENENIDINPNETRRPETAFVSPSVFDSSVSTSSPDPAAVENAITTAAARLADSNPSREAWRKFIDLHGLAAFEEQLNTVLGRQGINNKGAYLNKLLDAYTPPQPPPKPKPPKVYTGADWILCGERCGKFDGKGCAAGVKVPPEHDPIHRMPPEECGHYVPLSDSAHENKPPALGSGTILKRTNTRQ